MPHEPTELLLHLLHEVQRRAPDIRKHSGGWYPAHLSPVLDKVRQTAGDAAAGWTEIEILAPKLRGVLEDRGVIKPLDARSSAGGAVPRSTRRPGESETAWLNRVKNDLLREVEDAFQELAKPPVSPPPPPAGEAGK